jgi:ABC-type methionine transport system ATPase subunit
VYSRAEVVLLDDVLAALDVHTAKHVVERCFRGPLLRGRTVLLVTHNVVMTAPVADYVISLGVDGRVRSRGTVKEALARDSVLKRELAQEEKELKKAEDVDSEDESAAAAAEVVPAQTGDGKLIMKEEIAEGHVSWAASMFDLSSPLSVR